MDCDTVQQLVGNYANEELIETLRRRINHHLTACAACASFYRGERDLTDWLGAASAGEVAGEWFAERLLMRLADDNDALIDRPSLVDPAQLTFRDL